MNAKNFTLDNLQNLTFGRAVFEKKLGGLSAFRFGSEYWHTITSPITMTHCLNKLIIILRLLQKQVFIISKDLAAQIGTRFEHSSLINRSDIAPRVSLAYKTGKSSQISLAYGIFYQKPESQQLYLSDQRGFYQSHTLYHELSKNL